MKERLKNIYLFFDTLPDRLYPFSHQIGDEWVRGQRAYKAAIAEAFKTHGEYHLGMKLIVYRGSFHLVGSILFIVSATLLSKELFGSDVALYVLLAAAIVALLVQEFFFDPKRYHQPTTKGIVDVMTWVIPMVLYIAFFVS